MSEENVNEETAVAEEVVTYGIKETKEMVAFGIAVGEAIDQSLADNGKIGLEDAMKFYNAVLAAGSAFDNAGLIAKEVKDMDQAERDELYAYVEAEFDIANDKLEEVIEVALATALQVYKLVETIKGLKA